MPIKNESAEFILGNSGLSTDGIRASILSYFHLANSEQLKDGMEWYDECRADAILMSERSGWNVIQCAALLAHTSPKTRWKKNRQAAWTIAIEGPTETCDMTAGIIWTNQRRAIAALLFENTLDSFGGPKTRNFCLNIAGDDNAVTIDVWICKALGFEQKLLNRKGLYEAIADIFRIVASELNVTPAQLQAIVWCVINPNYAVK